MSANHESRDGLMTPLHVVSKFEEAIINAQFDEQVNFDIAEYEQQQREIKLLKRVCWIKTLTYPWEYLITYLFLGKEALKERTLTQKYYWMFIRNKMKLNDFKVKINDIIDNSSLGR